MITTNRCILILLLLSTANYCYAQSGADSIRKRNVKTRIALTDLLGDWYVMDSQKTKISFINLMDVLVEMKGIKHGVGHYSFPIKKDSVEVNGSAANWPPYYCTLSMQDNNTIKILFYDYLYPGNTSISITRK